MSTPPNFNSMRQSHLPQSTNQSSTGQSVNEKTIQSVNEPNIMGQLVSYNNDTTNTFIEQLQEEYNDQEKINQILKAKNYEENKIEIENFIEDNAENVSTQINTLEGLFSNFKNILKENNDLLEDEEEFKFLISSTEVKNVARDMRKLKSLKNNIMLFLQQNGIQVSI